MTMENLVAYEERRVAQLAAKKDTAKEVKPKAEGAAGKQDAKGEPEAEGAAAGEEGEEGEEKPLKAAEASKLFEVLFDQVEAAPVTSIGVDGVNTLYGKMIRMLAERAEIELESAIERTKQARKHTGYETEELKDGLGKFTPREYSDGENGCPGPALPPCHCRAVMHTGTATKPILNTGAATRCQADEDERLSQELRTQAFREEAAARRAGQGEPCV